MTTDPRADQLRVNLLRVRVGGETILVSAAEVRRVIEFSPPHQVPRSRHGLAGFLFDEGAIIGVADLAGLLFGNPDKSSLLLIAGTPEESVALPIEAAEGVEACSLREIVSPSPNMPANQRRFTRALREDGNSTVIVLNSRAIRDYILGRHQSGVPA